MTPGRGDVIWLLDLDLGAGTHRFGVESVEATSRVAGGTVVYHPGLEVGALSVDAQSATVSVRVPEIAALARRVGTFRGRAAVLRAYRGEDVVEDAAALSGQIESVSWGDPGEPERLSVQVRRAGISSADICHPDAVLTDQTWGTGSAYDETQTGFAYPRVIGHPGRQYGDADGNDPAAAIPLVQVASAALHSRALFADGHVEAQQVQWYNVTQGLQGTEPVLLEEDEAGRAVSVISASAASLADGDEAFVGMSPRAGWGGGELHRGRLVEGLGDVLLWGSDLFGLGNFDLVRIEAERDRLNKYKVDAVANELGLRWDAWVQSNLLDQYGIEMASGPRGAWFREVVWAVTGTRSRAHLVVGSDTTSGGLPVVPVGGVEEADEEPATRITVAFAPRFASTMRLARQCTLAPRMEDRPAAGDWRFAVSPLCARGAELYRSRGNPSGTIAKTWEVSTTHDTTTALLIAQKRAQRHALPHSLLTYSGSHDLLDLPAYSEVTITDTVRGIEGRNAILLPGAVIEGRKATVRVRMPWA